MSKVSSLCVFRYRWCHYHHLNPRPDDVHVVSIFPSNINHDQSTWIPTNKNGHLQVQLSKRSQLLNQNNSAEDFSIQYTPSPFRYVNCGGLRPRWLNLVEISDRGTLLPFLALSGVVCDRRRIWCLCNGQEVMYEHVYHFSSLCTVEKKSVIYQGMRPLMHLDRIKQCSTISPPRLPPP